MASELRYFRGINGTDVYVAEFGVIARSGELRTLDPRFDLHSFSYGRDDIEFAWGANTAGAHQLALALLADVIGDDRKAVALARTFADLVIARLPAGAPWIMSDNIVRAVAGAIARSPLPA